MITQATVLADSLGPNGDRLTTLEVTFPRYVLAEFNTHRVFSRNSASSRAIPVERMIKKVLDDPFIPDRFPVNQTGMSAAEFYGPDDPQYEWCRQSWLGARDSAVAQAKNLLALNVHKQVTNRLLEPFMHHTVIVSSTDWDNFFDLRCALRDDGEPVADPEMYKAAHAMQVAVTASTPRVTLFNEWHTPLADEGTPRDRVLLSARRTSRSSYDRQHDEEPYDVSVAKAYELATAGHLSPWEHQATPTDDTFQWANFIGWVQARWYLERHMEIPA